MDGLRGCIAAALEAADTDCHTGCQPDPERLADAVLAVRDEELRQLRSDLDLVTKRACRDSEDLHKAQVERDALREAIARVRALHRKATHGDDCVYCVRGNNEVYDVTWPCDTVQALDA